jgi:methionyl aminopeptidase
MYKSYDYLENNVIPRLSALGYNIKPYKTDYTAMVDSNPGKKTRLTKDEEKQLIFDVNESMRKVNNLIPKQISIGTNIAALDRFLFKMTCQENAFPSVLGHDLFPKASCISVNDVVCHGVPYEETLQEGDIVSVDFCMYNGVHTDWAETYCVGKVSGDHRKLVNTTRECLFRAIDVCKVGARYDTIGKVVSKVARENGFKVIEKYGGHGIGSELHMKPFIPNVSSKTTRCKDCIMQVGDMFTIEPLLTLENGKTFVDKDGFSVKTKTKGYAAHFERTLLITEAGCIVLNDSSG